LPVVPTNLAVWPLVPLCPPGTMCLKVSHTHLFF
jgi:hypothetical protein